MYKIELKTKCSLLVYKKSIGYYLYISMRRARSNLCSMSFNRTMKTLLYINRAKPKLISVTILLPEASEIRYLLR